MMRRVQDPAIRLVYGAIFLLGIAYGISIALTPLHLDALHFSKEAIGSLAALFAAGIVALSVPMGALIRRFSARRTLAVALLVYAACVTVFPHLTSFAGIAAARFLDGASSVGIWVSSETILLSRAEDDNKAYVTSLYAVSMAIGYVVGPIGARLLVAVAPTGVAFLVSGLLAIAAFALVALRLAPDVDDGAHAHGAPTATEGAPRMTSLAILARIKTSCFGTFAYGYFQASVVLFLPLFLIHDKGVAPERTILVTAYFAAGMLLFSNVAGRLGDALGHLRVMRILGAIGMTMVACFVFLDTFALMACAVFVAGATLASISPVSLALQGVVTPRGELARSNGIYNAFYAGGMLLGPPISSVLFARYGGAGMLYHLAAMWAAFVAFTVVFAGDDPRRSHGDLLAHEAGAQETGEA